jgi:hypothetical protein
MATITIYGIKNGAAGGLYENRPLHGSHFCSLISACKLSRFSTRRGCSSFHLHHSCRH